MGINIVVEEDATMNSAINGNDVLRKNTSIDVLRRNSSMSIIKSPKKPAFH